MKVVNAFFFAIFAIKCVFLPDLLMLRTRDIQDIQMKVINALFSREKNRELIKSNRFVF